MFNGRNDGTLHRLVGAGLFIRQLGESIVDGTHGLTPPPQQWVFKFGFNGIERIMNSVKQVLIR